MQIKMKAALVGPGLHLARHQKYHLPSDRAREIVAAGLATEVPPDTATVKPAAPPVRRDRATRKNMQTR